MFRKICWCLLLAVLLPAGGLRAQNTIRGRVIDDRGAGVPGIEVLLHRVTTTSGGSVALDTTDAQGAFTLVAPPDTNSDALYFVAVQEGGQLFMGEMQRMPFPDTLEYIIEATDPVQFGPPEVAPEDRRAGIFVILGGVVLVAAVVLFALRRRPPAYRRILVELANLDDNDTSEATARRRRQLYAQLKRNS